MWAHNNTNSHTSTSTKTGHRAWENAQPQQLAGMNQLDGISRSRAPSSAGAAHHLGPQQRAAMLPWALQCVHMHPLDPPAAPRLCTPSGAPASQAAGGLCDFLGHSGAAGSGAGVSECSAVQHLVPRHASPLAEQHTVRPPGCGHAALLGALLQAGLAPLVLDGGGWGF